MQLEFADSQPPESRTVDVNGVRLRYLDWGNSHLPDLLFVHGFAQQAHSWDFAALAVHDLFHVTAIDLRGHGESQRSPGGNYSFDDFYTDLEAFIPASGLRDPVLCGLSLGGALTSLYASRNSESIRALVIAESAPESRSAGRDAVRSFTSGPGEFESLDELVDKVRQLTPWRTVAQVRSSLVHSVGKNSSRKWTWKYDPAIRTLLDSPRIDPATRWAALEKITAPTLLVRGEDSDITDADVIKRMQQAIPGSQIASIARAGHRVSGDNPKDFNNVLRRFLAEHARSEAERGK